MTAPSAASRLTDEFEIELELTLIAVSKTSKLDDEFERLSDDV